MIYQATHLAACKKTSSAAAAEEEDAHGNFM